jgi:hypothetical protein
LLALRERVDAGFAADGRGRQAKLPANRWAAVYACM